MYAVTLFRWVLSLSWCTLKHILTPNSIQHKSLERYHILSAKGRELCLLATFSTQQSMFFLASDRRHSMISARVHFIFPSLGFDYLKHSRSQVVQLLPAGLCLAAAAKIQYCSANVHRAVNWTDSRDLLRQLACAVCLLGETPWSPNTPLYHQLQLFITSLSSSDIFTITYIHTHSFYLMGLLLQIYSRLEQVPQTILCGDN